MLEDGEGLLAEFLETGLEDDEILVVVAVATVVEDFGGLKAFLDICFGDIEDDYGFNFVIGFGGSGHDFVLFAGPATDRGQN